MESVPNPVNRPADAPGDPEVAKTLGIGKSKSRGRWILRIVVLLSLAALAAGGIFRCVRERSAQAVPEYKTAPVEKVNIQVTLTATGSVKGLNTVEVGAEVSGRVTKVHVDWNERIKKGQILAEIDPEQQKATVDEASARVIDASASIRQARATATEARQNAARAIEQAQAGLISQKELEAAKAAADRAEAGLSSAMASATVSQASLKSAKTKLDRATIVSPIDGIVLSRLVEPGQTVTAGFQTPVLFKLAEDLSRMALHVNVDEADIGRAKEGQAASFTVDAYPDKVFPSKVLSLRNEPKTDQNVVTYEAVLAVDNAELLLRPGMTATATIVAEVHKDVIGVPNAALRFTPTVATTTTSRGGALPLPGLGGGSRGMGGGNRSGGGANARTGPRVWVLEGVTPKAIPVKVGASDGRVSEITEGEVTPGMQVLVDLVEKK